MITAIPMNEDRIASHFSKAKVFMFLNTEGVETKLSVNPALNSNCAGKQALIELLQAQGAERIIVRNIGQQMLNKLMGANIRVYQIERGHEDLSSLAAAADEALTPITEVSPEHISFQQRLRRRQQKSSCCGKGHHHEGGHGGECHGHGRGHGHGHRHGHGHGGKHQGKGQGCQCH